MIMPIWLQIPPSMAPHGVRLAPARGASLCALLLLLAGLAAGCRPAPSPTRAAAPDPAQLDAGRALEEVRALVALGARDAGTDGARRAALHLAGRLRAFGIQAEIDGFSDGTPEGRKPFWNVIGECPARPGAGEAPWFFFGSHFDTKSGLGPRFEGANDSASSSGLLLELARGLQAGGPWPVNIGFLFFDGEECLREYGPADGLHGSRRAARQLVKDGRAGRTLAVLVLDMVGDRNLTVTVPRNGTPRLAAALFRAAAAEGVRNRFSLMDGGLLDDHVPFLKAGIPATVMIDFEYGSAPGRNDYWHTEQDTLDKLSADSLGVAGRVAIRMLEELMETRGSRPAQSRP